MIRLSEKGMWARVANANSSYFIQMRMTVNNIRWFLQNNAEGAKIRPCLIYYHPKFQGKNTNV